MGLLTTTILGVVGLLITVAFWKGFGKGAEASALLAKLGIAAAPGAGGLAGSGGAATDPLTDVGTGVVGASADEVEAEMANVLAGEGNGTVAAMAGEGNGTVRAIADQGTGAGGEVAGAVPATADQGTGEADVMAGEGAGAAGVIVGEETGAGAVDEIVAALS